MMQAVPGAEASTQEERRLIALERYDVLDTPPEEPFERITALASRVLDVPMSMISLVDRDRQWFKSCFGWNSSGSTREISFCSHALLVSDPLVVPDARLDPRFADNPLVTGDPHIRFYAGAPLKTAEGYAIGTLCVIDRNPRQATREQLDILTQLAAIVVDELELRLALHRVRESEKQIATALADAERAEETRSRFLSSMSHELRTPLNAILGFAQLLKIEDLPASQKRDVDGIIGGAQRLMEMLEEIFDTEESHREVLRHTD